MDFVDTQFGLLPIQKNFVIPVAFRIELETPIRSFYSNKNFLEILESQPSLHQEHKFLYDTTSKELYSLFLEALRDPNYKFIKVSKIVILDEEIPDSQDIDILDLYGIRQKEKIAEYTKNVEAQFVKFIDTGAIPLVVKASYDKSYGVENIKGEYFKRGMERIKKEAFHIINDTVINRCGGKISTVQTKYISMIISALKVASMLIKEFYITPLMPSDEKMVRDMYNTYVKGKEIQYMKVSEYKKFNDKNNILSALFSPSLFQKMVPFAEKLSQEFRDILEKYNEITEYIDKNGDNDKDAIIDLTPDMYKKLNECIRNFYTELVENLSEKELKEFLTESTMFDEYNKSRYELNHRIIDMSMVIRDEYVELYRQRDRQLIIPTDKFYRKMLKAGTILYRGYKKMHGPINDQSSFSFFSLNPVDLFTYMLPFSTEDTLKKYMSKMGGIAVFRLKKDVEMMDFSNLTNIEFMRKILRDENAPSNIVSAFEESWMIKGEEEGNKRFVRNSYESTDLEFMSWLCEKGYGGYIGMDLEDLHDEVALCFSRKDEKRYVVEEDLDYMGTIDHTLFNFPLFQEPYLSYPDLNVKYIMSELNYK